MKNLTLLLVLLLGTFSVKSQQSKWIVAGGQMDTFGNYYTLGTNHLKFYELDFTNSPIQVSQRPIGNSIRNISCVGTADPLVAAYRNVSQGSNLDFYVFSAAKTTQTGNPTIAPADTFYIAAYNSATSADEIYAKFPTNHFGSSVVDIEMSKLPCHNKEEDYYIILYKTNAATILNDEIKYVIFNGSNKTLIQQPTILDQNLLSGEGLAITQTAPHSNSKYFLYTNLDTTGGNVVMQLKAAKIDKNGIGNPFIIDTLTLISYAYPGINACGIEVAPDNAHLAITIYAGSYVSSVPSTIIYDFNLNNCSVSNRKLITSNSTLVNTTFSPNGQQVFSYSNSLQQLYYYSLPNTSFNISSNGTPALYFGGLIKPGGLHMQVATDGNLYFNPGHGTKTLIKIQNPNNVPSYSTLGNYFFGPTSWAGNDLPEQIDGQDYSIDTCYWADGISSPTIRCQETGNMNFFGRNTSVFKSMIDLENGSYENQIIVRNNLGSTVFTGYLETLDLTILSTGVYYYQLINKKECPTKGRIVISY